MVETEFSGVDEPDEDQANPSLSKQARSLETFKNYLVYALENLPEVRAAVRAIFIKGKRNIELKPLTRDELVQRLEHVKPYSFKGRPIAYPSAKVKAVFPEYTNPELYDILSRSGLLIKKSVQKWVANKQIRCVLLDFRQEDFDGLR